MLTWEDKSTVALQPVPSMPAAPAATAHAPVTSTESAPHASVKPAGARVNAADKRIINGQTDVNQLVPFKYKWAW
ncbi:hypothetical protein RZS08_27315, partial [Arthrospira platensis SPKY1]|nr:hypothetical protein [Arthrospira platensis SPKY1]